jgi:hypothetical protein
MVLQQRTGITIKVGAQRCQRAQRHLIAPVIDHRFKRARLDAGGFGDLVQRQRLPALGGAPV